MIQTAASMPVPLPSAEQDSAMKKREQANLPTKPTKVKKAATKGVPAVKASKGYTKNKR